MPSAMAGVAQPAFGLEHEALGNAMVTVMPSQVVISDLGPAGDDGVAIALGDAAGWVGAVDFGQAGQLSPGMHVSLATTFATGGVPGSAGIAIDQTGGGLASVQLGEPGCACVVTVELRLGGAVVNSIEPAGPPYGEIAVGMLGSDADVAVTLRTGRATSGDGVVAFSLLNPTATPITLAGSDPVEADEIRVLLAGAPSGVTTGHSVALTAANLAALTIDDEGLVQFADDHRVTGDLAMLGVLGTDGQADVLVSNVTAAGYDEVLVTPPADLAEPIGTVELWLDLPVQGPPLYYVARSTHARLDDGSTSEIAASAMGLGVCGCAYGFYVEDPPAATQATKLVSGLLDGVPVDDAGPPGDAMWYTGTGSLPDSWSVEVDLDDPGLVYREVWRWEQPAEVTLYEGHGPVVVNEVRVDVTAAPVPGAAILSLAETRLAAAAIFEPTSFVIDDESFRAPDAGCPADLNGDGQVGAADFLAVLGSWGPCPGCASDLDANGAVGVNDLLILLGSWGLCR